jgi:WXG100 family type VII secretion target
MPYNGFIGYDYDKILDGISDMNDVNKNVEALIQGLSQKTGTALESWTGPAAANYNELSQRIEKNFADMNQIVHDLAVQLSIRAEDMKAQDVRSGNRFGS